MKPGVSLKTSSSALGPALVLLCVVVAYSNSFSGAFLLDDHRRIVRNPDIRSLGTALTRSERPVLNATFWLNYAADGVRPEGYHLFNVALHACSALILYGLVRRILESGRFGPASSRAAAPLGLLVASLWGVHPLATSGVNYISQRAESLMGFFYLLTVYASLRAAAGSSRSASVGWCGLAVGACALGMNTKQVMVTAPVMVVFVESMILFAGSFRDAFRQRWRFYACMAATWLVLLWGGTLVQKADPAESLVWGRVSPFLYAVTQAGVIVRYLQLSFWPRPLCFDYRWLPAEGLADSWPAVALVAACLVLTVWLLYKRSAGALPGVWVFGILAPTSSFVARPDFAFEHRMYLPVAGVIAFAAVSVHAILHRRARPAFLCLLATVLVFGTGFMTHLRNRDYRDEVSMWSDVVRKAPHNLRAWNDLAVALSEEGRVAEALETYARVLDAIPPATLAALDAGSLRAADPVPTDSFEFHYFRAHANMGLLKVKGLGDPAGAVRHYAAALRVIPYREDVRKKLRSAMMAAGIPGDEFDAVMREPLP